MSTLKLKKSSVVGKVPLVGDLEYGELALNYADGYIYYKDNSNNIQRFLDSDGIVSAARNSIVAGTDIGYDPATGVISFTGLDSAVVSGLQAVTDIGNETTNPIIAREFVFDSVPLEPGQTAASFKITESPYDGIPGIEMAAPALDSTGQHLILKGGGGGPAPNHLHLHARNQASTHFYIGTDDNHFMVTDNNSGAGLSLTHNFPVITRTFSSIRNRVYSDQFGVMGSGFEPLGVSTLSGIDLQGNRIDHYASEMRLTTRTTSQFHGTYLTAEDSVGVVRAELQVSAWDSCVKIIKLDDTGEEGTVGQGRSLWVQGWAQFDSSPMLNNLVVDNTESTLLLLDTNNKVVTTDITTLVDSDYVAARSSAPSNKGSTTLTTTSQTAIDTFAHATNNVTEYLIHANRGSIHYAAKVVLLTDGTTSTINQYAEIGNSLGTFSADVSGANARLLFTSDSAASTDLNWHYTRI